MRKLVFAYAAAIEEAKPIDMDLVTTQGHFPGDWISVWWWQVWCWQRFPGDGFYWTTAPVVERC